MKDGEKQGTRREPAAGRHVSIPAVMTIITCPSCGTGVDLWTGDEETRCFACEYLIFRKQRASH